MIKYKYKALLCAVLCSLLLNASIYSLNSLSLLPNLKQLVVKIDACDDSVIEDFTPIAQALYSVLEAKVGGADVGRKRNLVR